MTAALILAAGSIAEGSKFDPTAKIDGYSPLRRLISTFYKMDIDRIVVVTGFNAERVASHGSHTSAIFIHNPNFEDDDMLASIKFGLNYLADKCDRTFIAPVNVPFFTVETLEALASAHTGGISIPAHGVKVGHPLLASTDVFNEIIGYSGEDGMQGMLASTSVNRTFVNVSDKRCLYEINDETIDKLPEDVTRLKVEASVKVMLRRGERFFGPGALKMLMYTEECGSKQNAAERTGISYSKCNSLTEDIVAALGYPIYDLRRGGRDGKGGVDLNEQCHDLLRRYKAFMKESEKLNNELFEKHFGDTELW